MARFSLGKREYFLLQIFSLIGAEVFLAFFSSSQAASPGTLAPSNDNFVNRFALTGTSVCAVSSNTSATSETNEPHHGSTYLPARSLWWTWRSPYTGTASISVVGFSRYPSFYFVSTFDVVDLAVYTGNDLATLTKLTSVEGYLNNSQVLTVTFPVNQDTDYQIAYDKISVWPDDTLALCINPPPVITPNLKLFQHAGEPLSYSIPIVGSATSFAATGLPTGLNINTSTGVISGVASTTGTYTATLTASSPSGTASAPLNITIADPWPPTITSPAEAAVDLGSPFNFTADLFTYNITATKNPTSFNAEGLPLGFSVDTTSGLITGMPASSTSYNSEYKVTISATNAQGTGKAMLILQFRSNYTDAPCITSPAMATGIAGDPFTYKITASRIALGAQGTYAALNLPPGLVIDTNSGVISGTPTTTGHSEITIQTKNSIGTTSATLGLNVYSAYTSPTITSAANASGIVGVPFSFQLTADQNPTSFWATGLPYGLTINTTSGLISGTPTAPGTFIAQLHADGPYGGGTLTPFTMVILGNATGLPIITSPAMAFATRGQPFYYQISANNKVDSYGAASLPSGLTINSKTGMISGTIDSSALIGTTQLPIMVTNSFGTTTARVMLTLGYAQPCVTNSAAVNAIIGQSFTYTLSYPAYNYAGYPPGMTPDGMDILGTPTTAGFYPTQFNLADDSLPGVVTMYITATPTPLPVITSSAVLTAYVNDLFTYFVQASNSPFWYDSTSLPSGWSLDPVTGRLTGIPIHEGTYTIPLTATNGYGTSQATLTLHVLDHAKTYPYYPSYWNSAAACYGVINQPFYYKLTTNTKSSIIPSLYSLPPGLTFNPYTKEITGTPTSVGSTLVTMGLYGYSNALMTIEILSAPPLPPVITSNLVTQGTIGVPLRYQITADNYPTTYSAPNLPAEFTLNTKSGLITGTPKPVEKYVFDLTATNATGSTTARWTLLLPSSSRPSAITSSAMVEGTLSTAGVIYQTTLSNPPISYPPVSFSADGLPAGLSIDSATGAISGTPQQTGDSIVTITGSYSVRTISAKVLVRIKPLPAYPLLTSAAGSRGTVGQPYSFTLTTTNPGASFQYWGGNTPPGLSLNPATGQITGTPTKSGDYSIYLMMTGNSSNNYGTFTLKIDPGYPVTNAPIIGGPFGMIGVVGSAPSARFISTDSTSLTADNLPDGLTWAQGDGTLTTTTGTTVTVQTIKHGILCGIPTTTGYYQIPITAVSPGGTTTTTLSLLLLSPQYTPPTFALNTYSLSSAEGGQTVLTATVSGLPAPDCQWLFGGNPIPGATSSTLTIPATAPADKGAYSLVVSNSTGSVRSGNVLLNVLSTFNQWQNRLFTPNQLADPNVSGPGAAPQGDGVPNLLKYALNIDPTRPVAPEDAAAFPAANVETGTTQYLSLMYRQNNAATGVAFEIQTSTDLVHWQTVTPDVTELVGTDTTTGDSILRKKVQCTGEPTKFIRLRVVAP